MFVHTYCLIGWYLDFSSSIEQNHINFIEQLVLHILLEMLTSNYNRLFTILALSHSGWWPHIGVATNPPIARKRNKLLTGISWTYEEEVFWDDRALTRGLEWSLCSKWKCRSRMAGTWMFWWTMEQRNITGDITMDIVSITVKIYSHWYQAALKNISKEHSKWGRRQSSFEKREEWEEGIPHACSNTEHNSARNSQPGLRCKGSIQLPTFHCLPTNKQKFNCY